MESETFRSRVLALIQKSRRALRLYSSAGSTSLAKTDGVAAELSTAQVSEWRSINNLLLKKLTEAVESPNAKRLVYDVFALRNEFQSLWRGSEAELVVGQRDLMSSSERGDFIRAATLASSLVTLKARVQAGQAAHHELDMLIRKSRVVRPTADGEASADEKEVEATIELLGEHVVEERPAASTVVELTPRMAIAAGAKIIPLKRR